MKIKYEFINGEVFEAEVEVSDEIAQFFEKSLKAEHANDEKNRVHNYSLDAAMYEGKAFGYMDARLDRLERVESQSDLSRRKKENRIVLKNGFKSLTEVQRRRILMYSKGLSEYEIAEKEEVNHKTVHRSLAFARKKFKKIQNKNEK